MARSANRARRRHARPLGAEVTCRSTPSFKRHIGQFTASRAPAAAVRLPGRELMIVRPRRQAKRAAPRAGAATRPATARRRAPSLALSTHMQPRARSVYSRRTHPRPRTPLSRPLRLSASGERCAPRRVGSRGAVCRSAARATRHSDLPRRSLAPAQHRHLSVRPAAQVLVEILLLNRAEVAPLVMACMRPLLARYVGPPTSTRLRTETESG